MNGMTQLIDWFSQPLSEQICALQQNSAFPVVAWELPKISREFHKALII